MKGYCAECGKYRDILPANNPAYDVLCVPCRRRKSARDRLSPPPQRAGQVRCTVVIGPPASGKTTWIHQHAQPGDLVIDFDAITRALSGPHATGWTVPSPLIGKAAFDARAAAIRVAFRVRTEPNHAWLIHACPTATALSDYQRRGASIVVCDPGRDVVLARIAAERPADKVKVALHWYDEARPSYPAGLVA
ncbi:ATP-binding protein [Mycobacterium sp. MYCO198283]|uniref:ATP-binding protein n=1 Tax=Mycobacterium sp. MYCO198283 TaxID=2883505 RepID=UPI001E5E4803|nr:ATP-binding protein [Mycobacterium sp. MYCO198283]MCG5431226.1 ATP-binding protein [Mycobacterium sp. MYCO198283]